MIKYLHTILIILLTSTAYAGDDSVSEAYIDEAFQTISTEVGVPPSLLRAICWSESKHDPEAFNHGDGAGNNHAFGICQVLHSTAREFGFRDDNCYKSFDILPGPVKTSRKYKDCKLFGVKTNITYAAKYLKSKLDKYDNSWISAIAAYNTGILRTCKTGKVLRVKDRSVLYTCKRGGILNQKYVDGVIKALDEGK